MEQQTQKISTPMAIIVAGFLIMIGIIVAKGGTTMSKQPVAKTLSEQVDISKEKLTACIAETDSEGLNTRIAESVDKAMSHIPKEKRGTPYSIVIGPNGFMTEIRGAASQAQLTAVVEAAKQGKLAQSDDGSKKGTKVNLTELYKGNVVVSEPNDHVMGSAQAQVTIIEYSDFECPYCKSFHPALAKQVKDSAGSVKWIYRNYPLHQHSFEKIVAAECVAKLKGNDTYWKYADLLFGLLKTAADPISDTL